MQRVATGRQALESERTPNTDRTRSHPAGSRGSTDPRNKWIATSSPKTGFLTAGRNASVTLVTPPGIVPGIKTNPLLASNAPVFVRLPMGYLLATGILVVSFRCLLDRCGRGKLLNLGFAISAAFSILLGAT